CAFGRLAMPKAYSADMRERVIAEVEGGASRREAAEEFEVSAGTAIIWVKCFRETGRCSAKPRGGSISPLEKHADFLLGLIEKQSNLTLDEVVLAMRKHKITFGAPLRRNGMRAPCTVGGSMNGAKFLAYVKQCLAPTLKRKDNVVIDNLP